MKTTVIVAALALAISFMAGCSTTKPAVTSENEDFGVDFTPFQTIDLNLDKQITEEEFEMGFFRLAFVSLDKNDDMLIDRAEWTKVEDRPDSEKMFVSMDKNKDNLLTYPEFSEPETKQEIVENLFKTLDANGDGVITPDEGQTTKPGTTN
jgi:Ca2+-binding EF-hand superfamily protein